MHIVSLILFFSLILWRTFFFSKTVRCSICMLLNNDVSISSFSFVFVKTSHLLGITYHMCCILMLHKFQEVPRYFRLSVEKLRQRCQTTTSWPFVLSSLQRVFLLTVGRHKRSLHLFLLPKDNSQGKQHCPLHWLLLKMQFQTLFS